MPCYATLSLAVPCMQRSKPRNKHLVIPNWCTAPLNKYPARRALLTPQQRWPPSLGSRATPLPLICQFHVFHIGSEKSNAVYCSGVASTCRQPAKTASYFPINKYGTEWSELVGSQESNTFTLDSTHIHLISDRMSNFTTPQFYELFYQGSLHNFPPARL